MINLKQDKVLVSGLNEGIRSSISLPGDKSISHRAIMLGGLAGGKSFASNLSLSRDNRATVSAFRKLGVKIEKTGIGDTKRDYTITGNGLDGLREPSTVINTANSGTLTRLIAGILAGNPFFSVLYGDKYLNRRPMKRIIEPLSLMGGNISGRKNGNYPPLAIRGTKLNSIYYEPPVPSAQVKSCIILASLYADGITVIHEKKATRDHTENFLKLQGYPIKIEDSLISVKGRHELKPFDVCIPGDFSSAAFFIALGLLLEGSEVTIRNVLLNDKRTGLLEVLKRMGADISVETESLSPERTGTVTARYSRLESVSVTEADVPDMIDEFPVFAVIASFASGITRVSGAGELRVKESDRIKTIVHNIKLLGINVREFPDGFEIEGNPGLGNEGGNGKYKKYVSPVTDSFGDHRIAMSMVIMGLLLKNRSLQVKDIECINTSFPEFFDIISGFIKL